MNKSMFTTNPYKTIKRVFFAVTRTKIGSIPKDHAVFGLQAMDKDRLNYLISDWCANNDVKRNKLKIVKGYVPDKITNYEIYQRIY